MSDHDNLLATMKDWADTLAAQHKGEQFPEGETAAVLILRRAMYAIERLEKEARAVRAYNDETATAIVGWYEKGSRRMNAIVKRLRRE